MLCLEKYLILIEQFSLGGKIIIGVFFCVLLVMLFSFVLKMLEMGYVMRHKKPFFVHSPFFLKNCLTGIASKNSLAKKIVGEEFNFSIFLTQEILL